MRLVSGGVLNEVCLLAGVSIHAGDAERMTIRFSRNLVLRVNVKDGIRFVAVRWKE
jgi:hypothetical protein